MVTFLVGLRRMSKNYVSVVECLERLDTGSKARLRQYRKNLSTDKNPAYFDDQLRDFIQPYLTEHGRLTMDRVNKYNDSVNYTASAYEYAQIEEQLDHFHAEDVPCRTWMRAMVKAKEHFLNEVSSYNLPFIKPQSEKELEDLLPKKDTHAGWLYVESGLRSKGDYVGKYLHLRDEALQKGLSLGNFGYPILIGTRTQASVPWDHEHQFTGVWKKKTRLVSMVDLRIILCELPYAKPVQDRLSGLDWYAGGKNDSQIKGVINKLGKYKPYRVTIDYSKFDMHQSSWLIREAFDIVRAMYSHLDDEAEKVFDVIINSYLDKTFVSANGLVHSYNGTPSGDMFTQIIDSIVNRLMVLTYFYHKEVHPHDYAMIIMGDDNLIFSNRELDVADLASYLTFNFGIEVNPSKMSVSKYPEPPEFLSRWWTTDGCDRSDEVVVTKLLYPERFADYGSKNGNHPRYKIASMIWAYPVAAKRVLNIRKFLDNEFSERVISKMHLRLNLNGYLRYALTYWSQDVDFRL